MIRKSFGVWFIVSLTILFFVNSAQLCMGQAKKIHNESIATSAIETAESLQSGASVVMPTALNGLVDRKEPEEGTEFWPLFHGFRLKITDTLLAFFTALLFIATLGLWLATQKLVRDSSDSSKTELRAYVSLADKGALFLESEPNKHSIRIQVVLENAGRTPAKDFSTWFGGCFNPSESIPFPVESKRLSERVNRSIMGAGATVNIIPEPMILNDFEFQELVHGSKAVFLWGGADYVDVFGRPQNLFFRMKMTGKPINLGNGIVGWHLMPHPLGYKMS